MANEADPGVVDTEGLAQFVAEYGNPVGEATGGTEPVVEDNTPAEPVVEDQDTDPTIDGVLGEDPDLSELNPEARVIAEQRIKDMRADYTRKTTEIAQIRKMADEYAGGDVELMQRSLEFTHRLQTDPEFRAALYQELHGQQGTPVPQAGVPEVDDDYLDDDDIPSGVKSQMSQLEQRLARFEQQAAQQAEEARQNHLIAQATNDLDRQMSDIRKMNPDIKDHHVEQIYGYGHATGGDLFAAEQMWRDIRNEAQAELINSKNAIPDSIGAGRPSSNAETPAEPITTFEQASEGAAEFLRQHMQG